MTAVKSLLLGSVAVLVAVAGALAADVPVPAKPAEYVKVCSLYGAGFWYVPGTDTCMKLGAYVRAQVEWGAGDGGIPIGDGTQAAAGRFTRSDTSDLNYRYRAVASLDLRTQTEYGTLRSYANVGTQITSSASWGGTSPALNTSNNNNNIDADRAFIQFAGLIAGRYRSVFDINALTPYSLDTSRVAGSGDVTAPGTLGLAYRVSFGDGFSARVALEDPGSTQIGRGRFTANLAAGAFGPTTIAGTATFDNRGIQFFDPVASLRLDRAWGYAQFSGALHDDSGGYYTNLPLGAGNCAANTLDCGHPTDKWGWAGSAGFFLKDLFGLRGDVFGAQFTYAEGAAGYVSRATGSWWQVGAGNKLSMGLLADGVYANGTAIELTQTWGANVLYEHHWNPKWRTSAFGGYVADNYDNAAKSMICAPAFGGGAAAAGASLGYGIGKLTAGSICNPDFSYWQAGTRTMWNPHPDLDIGIELLYTALNTANAGSINVAAASGALPGGIYNFADQGVWSVLFRLQRNFLY